MRFLRSFRFSLDKSVTQAASYAPTAVNFRLARYRELIVTWDIESAERDTGNETYDLYLISGDGVSEWDLVHFPQITATGAKRYTARVIDWQPSNITTASPGVSAIDSATLATAASATNAPKSLAAGSVRHGPFGNYLRYELVVAGTVTTGIKYSLQVQAKE